MSHALLPSGALCGLDAIRYNCCNTAVGFDAEAAPYTRLVGQLYRIIT